MDVVDVTGVIGLMLCGSVKAKWRLFDLCTAHDFLGHKFLHDAATAPYEIGGTRFRLFAIEGKDAADARSMIAAFRALAKIPKADVPAEGAVTLKDDPSPARKNLVDELGRRLPRQ